MFVHPTRTDRPPQARIRISAPYRHASLSVTPIFVAITFANCGGSSRNSTGNAASHKLANRPFAQHPATPTSLVATT